MKNIFKEVKELWQERLYSIPMILLAIAAYGFKITHFTVGIDDTPYEYYFSDGMNVLVGRWVLYLINKFINIGDLAPFITDFLGVLLLLLGASLWTLVLKRVTKREMDKFSLFLFSAVFLTCPIICEVYTYFLHNGISIGYCMCALAVLMYLEADEKSGKVRYLYYLYSSLCLFTAIGCYESFASVFLAGCFIGLMLKSSYERDRKKKFLLNLLRIVFIAVIAALSIVLRALMQKLLILIFNITNLRTTEVSRSVGEMFAWISDTEARAEFVMGLKRFFVMYGVFAYAYLPILIFLIACLCLLVASVVMAIRNKTVWPFLYTVGIYISCVILVFIEGSVTLYRAAQFMPLVSAFGIFMGYMLLLEVAAPIKKYAKPVLVVICLIVICNQALDMNKWFSIDSNKYDEARRIMDNVGTDILKEVEDTGKPLIFIGDFKPSVSIIEDAYVPIGTETYYKMKRITDMVDEHLLDKFYRRNRVLVAQTPELSVIAWGAQAFESSYEIVRFLNMSGFTFRGTDDIEYIKEIAEKYVNNMPAYPDNGYIMELDDCIVVNFGMGY